MGLIHNKLYQGEEVTSVHMPDYLEDLGETLLDAYRLEEQVEVFYDVEDIHLDVDSAIPLGLIINELITNSLKYAFPNGREGTIEILLHREEERLRLSVSDNGVGAADAEKRADSTSFGRNSAVVEVRIPCLYYFFVFVTCVKFYKCCVFAYRYLYFPLYG